MKIFIYTELGPDLRSHLSRAFPDHRVYFRGEGNDTNEFNSAELLLGNPPKKWFSNPLSLRFWQLDSAGFEQYKEVQLDVPVANMGDFFAIKCAETMMAGILAFYRNIHQLTRFQQERKWVGKPLRYEMDLLSNKKVIILGAGTIAKSIRKMLSGFDCQIHLAARTNPDALIRSREQLIESLSEAELVINTLPGTAHSYVNKDLFNTMSPGTLYASVGRGNTTDESALINALESGKLSGAVLDVTESEPLPSDSPLWSMENVILTQHTAGGYKLEDSGKVGLFIENGRRFLKGEKLLNEIDLKAGY